ncbi:MAG: GNAT family N-acetyltransferase [Oscillatoriaceae bacterium SKW80]|nr:GNAT family N-acetyltransferase [Oscillatoriaceae bacterium SKYG93]MCX8122441.1 GNAT family N-acetyltransferase [Oscillatoriaceae bacterium SKW80]MDW8452634.1 GNAT family N-acetyltransferase [Oscillatoriaceae cyanobacterium SKYGB_i_bin93]HIK28040.1 GNAT family N-acetyltransferase [Oscillatoriaceae cyanobacterium M7585_C2015_266]
MATVLPQNSNTVIRPIQYRDLEVIEKRFAKALLAETRSHFTESCVQLAHVRRWYGLLKLLSLFPNPYQYLFCSHVAEQNGQLRGMIQISPFNRTRSTWRVERVLVDEAAISQGIGSLLLRHCMEVIWEARTWLLEVNVNEKTAMAMFRQNGFQPLAKMTYWALAPEKQQQLAQREPDLPNLLPVSNADAQLLCQLDSAAMPPLLRQVFDRHIQDFQTSIFGALIEAVKQWLTRTEVVSGYVFEPQRKAAIGYFQMQLSRDGKTPHTAQLTVHPAYTWLYPELLSQMARITQELPPQSLQLASADYQPEREEYLQQIGAQRIEHTLLMSRSVWHKLRESKLGALEALQLSDVLSSFQPVRKPVPGRMSSWLHSIHSQPQSEINPRQCPQSDTCQPSSISNNGHLPTEGSKTADS